MNWRIGKNVVAAIALALVVLVTWLIVRAFQKPGAMSVMEAQSMDMSTMLPPQGAVPVGLARVERGHIDGAVTYTGTVQAYDDEDVYPRITARIVRMTVYPGDHVKRGQLLAVLDPTNSEYAARATEARSKAQAATHSVAIARRDYEEKKQQADAILETQTQANKALDEVKANLAYWTTEIGREKILLDKDVISKQEYDNEFAQFTAAQAKVAQAEAKVREVAKACSAATEATAGMHEHIHHQLEEAQGAAAAAQAAAIQQSYTNIVASEDGVVTKRVVSPGVVVNPAMMILKLAHIRKVRLQAEVASTDVGKISVGNSISVVDSESSSDSAIKAHVTSVFPAADPSSRTLVVEALIDNAAPDKESPLRDNADQRLTTVTHYRFLPGQYVVMRISIGSKDGLTIPTSAIVWKEGKPRVWKASDGGTSTAGTASGAAQEYSCPMHPEVRSNRPGKCPKCGMNLEPVAGAGQPTASAGSSGAQEYSCLMHPEVRSNKPGKCPKCGMDLEPVTRSGRMMADLVDIKIGLSNSESTEVTEGLNEGENVVFAGFSNLRPGMSIVGTEWSKSGPVKLPTASEVAGNRLDSGSKWSLQKTVDNFVVNLSMTPMPPKGGNNSLVVKLEQQGGGAIANAQVTAKTSMPTMNMPGPQLSAMANGSGIYTMKSDFASGLWRANLTVSAAGKTQEVTTDIEVP
jgi:multidrug efflux pump subunit AcrA (membrane-fusion protein)